MDQFRQQEPDMDNLGGPSDHDADNIGEDIQNLAQAIALLCDKVETIDHMYDALNSHVDTLDKLINDDFIGGLTKMYDDNDTEMGIRSLQDKYGEQFGPYEAATKAFNPDFDMWSQMHQSLKGIKSQPGYTDEMGDAHIKSLLDGLTQRFGGVQAALSGIKSAAPAAVEVTKVEGAPVEGEAEESAEAPEVSEKQMRMMKIAQKLGSRVK